MAARQAHRRRSRERTRHFDPEAAVASRPHRATAYICTKSSPTTARTRLHCFSEERAASASSASPRASSKAPPKDSPGPVLRKTRTAHIRERIGRLKAKYAASQHYHIELDNHRRARHRRAHVPAGRGSMMTHPAVYCLRSNQTTPCGVPALTDIEAVFRSLKSELGPPHLPSQAHPRRRPSVRPSSPTSSSR